MTIENGVEQVRRIVQRGHDLVIAEGVMRQGCGLQGCHTRVLVDDPAFIEGADDGAEALDDGGGEVGLCGRLIRRPGQGNGVAVVGEHRQRRLHDPTR